MTSEAPELLPCPFCGGKAEMRQYGNEHSRTRGYDTACTNKNCRFGRKDRVFRYTLEWLRPRVVAAWNTRADLSPQWRPISEVKPNVLVDVWVVAKRRSESGRYVNMRLLDNGQWFGPQRLYPSDKITHFMPLPEAPNEP